MSLVLNMVGGGGGGSLKDTDAILTVTVPTGSTVTATKGGTTLTPTMWVQAADPTLDCALFVIAPAQFDSVNPWTVTATLETDTGTDTASTTVLITTNREYDVELSYIVYIIKNGVAPSETPIANNGGTLTYYTGYINLHSPASSGSWANVHTVNKINVKYHEYLVCDSSARGHYEPGCPAFGLFSNVGTVGYKSSFYAFKDVINAGTNTLSGRKVQYIDISQHTESYYIGFQEAGSGGYGWQGDFNCYNLYLSHTIPQ